MAYPYDIVLKNGTLIDPVNGRNGRFDVAVAGGRIAAVEPELDPSKAAQSYDLSGKTIIPGIIDSHVHVSSWIGGRFGHKMLALAGVTTALDVAGPIDGVLEIARDRHIDENVSFVRGNLSDPDIARRIIERGIVWDVLLSVYVIQELPDIESFIMNLAKLVQTSAYVIIVTVHPDFAGWLKQTGSLKLEENLTSSDEQETSSWRWAGYYPIVDEPNDTFTLPHFHRTVGDYRSLLGKSGFVVDKVLELPDKQRDLPHLVKQGFSPFSQFENNVYWPRIGEEPSALAIISRKETVSG